MSRTVQRVRGSQLARLAARGGLLARGALYLLLSYLAAAVAVAGGGGSSGTSSSGGEANANGALTAVASRPAGWIALALAAGGFAAFGLMRLAGAHADRRVGRLRRLTTFGQALFYLAMAAVTVRFLAGDGQAGSTRQQDSTAVSLMSSTPGRVLLAVVGLVVVTVCLWQLRLAVQGGYADSLDRDTMGPTMRAVTEVVGPVGIVARAAAALPIGALLVLAAGQDRASTARDLDELLVGLVSDPLGHALVWAVAAGFLVFAAYSLVEVRYRRVDAGD